MHVCISNVCCNGGTFEFKLKYPLHWGPRRQIGPDQARARARSSQTSQLLVLRLFNSDSAACPRPAAAGSASPGLSALGRAPLILGLCVWRETGDREGEGGGSPAWLCKHLPINQTIKHKASAWQKWYSSDSRHPKTALWLALYHLAFRENLPVVWTSSIASAVYNNYNDPPRCLLLLGCV